MIKDCHLRKTTEGTTKCRIHAELQRYSTLVVITRQSECYDEFANRHGMHSGDY